MDERTNGLKDKWIDGLMDQRTLLYTKEHDLGPKSVVPPFWKTSYDNTRSRLIFSGVHATISQYVGWLVPWLVCQLVPLVRKQAESIQQSRIRERLSCVLLGRGSNNTVYMTSGARRVVTDCLHSIAQIVLSCQFGSFSQSASDRQTECLIESRARD